MPGWVVVLIVIMVVGVAVIAYGYVHDRTVNRRRREQMLNPPDRAIPGFRSRGSAPTYLSGRQAHVAPRPEPPLSADHQAEVERLRSETTPLDVGYADKHFANVTEGSLAVLADPLVLVCAEPVGTIRELLPAIDAARRREAPLVVVAPELDATVVETLVVNRIQRLLRVVAVVAVDMGRLFEIAERTGAAVVDRSDLQAGYLPDNALGRCPLWVSASDRTWVASSTDRVQP